MGRTTAVSAIPQAKLGAAMAERIAKPTSLIPLKTYPDSLIALDELPVGEFFHVDSLG